MKQHTIIGMAGHIDHGKTALIKALTGIQTDNLPEEQERGITIDIGFAYWRDDITIIDVPGHEKFVHNMVAGVSTVDFFLLVIAADDGIMPQTIEHLDILKFFDVQQGIAVITKTDLVDEEWLELIHDETEQFLKEKGFDDVPVFRASAVANQGIDVLREHLTAITSGRQSAQNDRPFRLNIDRSFTEKGYGQVITGTVLSSSVKAGEQLSLLPEDVQCKVRGVQAHRQDASELHSGRRAALNISGIEKEKLIRGKVLAESETLKPTREILAEITTTDYFKFKIKRHSEMRIHLGTSEITGRMDWFNDENHLEQKTISHIRIKFKEDAVCAPGDAVLVRSLSPAVTVGGGRVLQINPPRISRNTADWPEYFKVLAEGSLTDRIKQFFEHGVYQAVTLEDLQVHFFENKSRLLSSLEPLIKSKNIEQFEQNQRKYLVSSKLINQLGAKTVKLIEEGLEKDTARKGYNSSEITAAFSSLSISPIFLEKTLKKAVNQKIIFKDAELYTIRDTARQEQTDKKTSEIIQIYLDSRFNPPGIEDTAKKLDLPVQEAKNLALLLAKQGGLKSIAGKFYLHKDVFAELTAFLKDHFSKQEELAVFTVRDFTGSSRKYIIPLLEFLDTQQITERHGEIRKAGRNL